MLSRIRIQNYKSIKDLTLHFNYAQKKAPNGFAELPAHPFIESAGMRLVPCMALYGPNASGKTSIIQAILLIVLFAQNNHPGFIPLSLFQPYLLKKLEPQATRIELEWTYAESRFCYSAAVAEDRITEETLSVDGKLKFRMEEGSILLTTEEGREAVEQGIRIQCIDASTQKQLRPVLPVIRGSFPGYDPEINNAYLSISTKINYSDRTIPPETGVSFLAGTFDFPTQEERESAALALISKYLQKLDVRIRRVEMKKTSRSIDSLPPELLQFFPAVSKGSSSPIFTEFEFKTFHLTEDGNEVPFKLQMESLGSQKLFGLLSFLLTAVRTGGTAVVDEFDNSLHPALLNEIIKLFQIREYNNKKSQFIFTLHNTELLSSDQLSVSEVAFVSQSGFNGTKVRRLSDFEDARNVNNFRKRYLMGYYDAIPSPFI